jgi:hypothetical protein
MSAKPRRIIAPAAPKRASVTVVGQNLIRGQHKADAEEEGENGEDREKHSDRHDDASLGLSPKAKCRRPCQFSAAMGRIVIESTRAEGLTVLRPDAPHRLDEHISVTPRIFKPWGPVAVNVGAIREPQP